jgi:hypothetical protein
MKRMLFLIFVVILSSCDNATDDVHGIMWKRADVVYICTGPMSQCYHIDRNCYGLHSCSKQIQSVSLEEAQEMGRRACRFCCE